MQKTPGAAQPPVTALAAKGRGKRDYAEVDENNPLAVQLAKPAPQLRVFRSDIVEIGDIGTGAAYSDLDAMGVAAVPVAVPLAGTLQMGTYFDRDDEGLRVDLWVFDRKPANQTDNAAFVVSDADLEKVICVIPFADFSDANTGQVSVQSGLFVSYYVPARTVWVQLQARGALNIAANQLPRFRLTVEPREA